LVVFHLIHFPTFNLPCCTVPLVLFIYFSGVYTCVAATDTGSDTDSGTLKVTGMPAELLQGPSDVTVLEGTDIQILCTVKGYPLPTHKWYKVNKDIF
jgi:hypothetical protein